MSVPGKGWFVQRSDGAAGVGGKDLDDVIAELRHELETGSYRTGDPFLSEKDLGDRYGLTRYGARRAFAALEADGLVVAVHGRGRFVSGHA